MPSSVSSLYEIGTLMHYVFMYFMCQGGFLAGLIIPHDNGFAIALVEKFEDLLSILFLPLV